MNYQVDAPALAGAAPKFEVIAGDAVDVGRRVSQCGADLGTDLGDAAVTEAVERALVGFMTDMRSVVSGVAYLAHGVGENAAAYIRNEENTSRRYRAAAGGPGAGDGRGR